MKFLRLIQEYGAFIAIFFIFCGCIVLFINENRKVAVRCFLIALIFFIVFMIGFAG